MVAIVMIRPEKVVGYILFNTINVLKKEDGRIKLASLQPRNMMRKSEAPMAAFKKEFTSKIGAQFGQKVKLKI